MRPMLQRMSISGADGARPFSEIGRRIVSVRRAHGLTQTAFAKRLGIRQHTLSEYESGERRPGVDTALVMREQFEMTLDYLYAGDHSGLPLRLVDAIRTGKVLR